MNGLACCAWCGTVCDDRRIWSKLWTSQGKMFVPYCSKECQAAGMSYLDEKVDEVKVPWP